MAVKFRDYYEVLGVPRTASEKDIKNAYRKLARQFHPDLQTSDAKKKTSEEKFKEINEANDVLSDPEKRKKYDQRGAQWKDGMDFTPPPGRQWQEHAWTGGQDFGSGDFNDFFEAVFGGGRSSWGRGQRRAEPARGTDLEAEIALPLEDLSRGGTRR